MLTLCSTGKPFLGHIGVIQRNALKSWTLLHSDVEIILFGDDEGAADVCAEYGLRHERHVQRNDHGSKRLDYMLDLAQEIAKHDVVCYVNCDIILMKDFCCALEQVMAAHPQFLMVGRRWDTEVKEAIDFCDARWSEELSQRALTANQQRDYWWIDYFAFSRGLYHGKVPPLVIGRVFWDNWLIWRAITMGVSVADASAVVRAIHQNHDYSYHPLGKKGVFGDKQAQRNFEYAGGLNHLRVIADATEVLTPEGLKPNRKRHWVALKRFLREVRRFVRYSLWNPVWFSFLDVTRPVRHVLGLRVRNKT